MPGTACEGPHALLRALPTLRPMVHTALYRQTESPKYPAHQLYHLHKLIQPVMGNDRGLEGKLLLTLQAWQAGSCAGGLTGGSGNALGL